MNGTPSPNQFAWGDHQHEHRVLLKLHWKKLAQLGGHTLRAEDHVSAFTARLKKVTSHTSSDLSTAVFLGLKMKSKTAAELVLDFVVENPRTALPERLDVLQLLERFVDSQFNAYVQDKFHVLPMDEQYENLLSMHRQGFENSHMEAALVARLNDYDRNSLEPKPLFANDNMDLFMNIADGTEKVNFVEDMVDGKPQFADTVFADYFAAKWLAGNFVANAAFLAQRLYSVRRTVMRYLFDRILARDCDLHTAVLHDDVVGVRRLLEVHRVDANARDSAGRTALHLSAAWNMHSRDTEAIGEIMDMLIDRSTDIDGVDDLFAGSPLLYADMSHSWTAIDKLLRCKADSRHLPSTSTNPASAAMLEDIIFLDLDRLMAFCLDNGLPVDYECSEFSRLLLWACDEGSVRVATLLIARGADINAIVGDYESPLVCASDSGSLAIVRQLVLAAKRAANLDASQHALAYVNYNASGYTALYRATARDNSDVAEYLIGEGADPWSRDANFGNTPLQIAVWYSSKAAAAMLIDAVDAARRADYVNVTNSQGDTAMHLAVGRGDLNAVRLLHNAGARLTARAANGRIPLMNAAENGNLDIVLYLIGNFDGGDRRLKVDFVNAKDNGGMSALHWAAYGGRAAVVRHLIGQGAHIDSEDNHGKKPLHFALVCGLRDCRLTPYGRAQYRDVINVLYWRRGEGQ